MRSDIERRPSRRRNSSQQAQPTAQALQSRPFILFSASDGGSSNASASCVSPRHSVSGRPRSASTAVFIFPRGAGFSASSNRPWQNSARASPSSGPTARAVHFSRKSASRRCVSFAFFPQSSSPSEASAGKISPIHSSYISARSGAIDTAEASSAEPSQRHSSSALCPAQ